MRLPVCVVAAGILVTAAVLPGPVVLRAQSGPAPTATSHLTAEAMETFLPAQGTDWFDAECRWRRDRFAPGNADRWCADPRCANPGDWKLWLIDHTERSARAKELIKPDDLKRCDRVFLEHLRQLTPAALDQATETVLTKFEREALMARRELLVSLYQQRIAQAGESNVLF